MVKPPDSQAYASAMRRLEILLEDSEQPVIAFGIVNNYPNFEQVVKELEPHLTKPVLARRVEPDDLNPFHILAELPAEKPTIVCVWFAGSPLPKEDGEPSDFVKFARYLNYGRERIQMYNHSLVLFFTDELLQEFIQYAPDFWSWREGVFNLRRNYVEPDQIRMKPFSELEADYEPQKLLVQIDLWSDLISQEQSKVSPNLGLIANALIQRAKAKTSLSRNDTETDLEAAFQLASQVGDKLAASEALMILGYKALDDDTEKAEALQQQSFDLLKEVLPQNHPTLLRRLGSLGIVYGRQKRYAEAEALFREILEKQERVLLQTNDDAISTKNNLAVILSQQKRYSEAKALYTDVLEQRQKTLPENHPRIATTLFNLAGIFDALGQYESAELNYKQSLEIFNDLYGVNSMNPIHHDALWNYGSLLLNLGRYLEAGVYLKQAEEIRLRRKETTAESTPTQS